MAISTTQAQRKVLRRVKDDVQRYGQCVMFIGGGDESPPFFYTIGRGKRGLPELIITLPIRPEVGKALLNTLDKVMSEAVPSESIVSIGGQFPGLVIDAPAANEEWTFLASAFHGGEDKYRVQQVIIPDRQGRFAPDGDAPFSLQPLLGPRSQVQ